MVPCAIALFSQIFYLAQLIIHPAVKIMKIQNSNRSGSRVSAWFALGLATVLGVIAMAVPSTARAGLPPVVTNVVASQQALPSKLVDIYYTLSDPDSLSASISILVSSNSGATWTVPATSFNGDYGPIVSDKPVR